MTAIAIPFYQNYIILTKNKAVQGNLDEATRFVRNQVSLNVLAPDVVTVASLLSGLNNVGKGNPCQPNQPAFLDASALPAKTDCFVTLEKRSNPDEIIVKGYDTGGKLINSTQSMIRIE